LLPRRSPGSSGITDVPAHPPEEQHRPKRELPTPWWETGVQQEPRPTPQPAPAKAASNTSAFFAARSQAVGDRAAAPAAAADDDVIYQRMLSEMLGDPHDLVKSDDLDWQSVWDRGWSAAAQAEHQPVEAHTEHGLPVRTPGARLVPGGAGADQEDQGSQDSQLALNGEFHQGRQPSRHAQHAAAVRDPDAVRASIGNHFGGVRTGRSHARETDLETGERPDQE